MPRRGTTRNIVFADESTIMIECSTASPRHDRAPGAMVIPRRGMGRSIPGTGSCASLHPIYSNIAPAGAENRDGALVVQCYGLLYNVV